jgi:hypothetical protein
MWIFVLIIVNEGHGIKFFIKTALMLIRGPVRQEEAGV